MAVFVYSSYWRTWSRLLLENMDRSGICVELNMTGHNGTWDRVPLEVIRKHCTARDNKDLITRSLPREIETAFCNHLGSALFHRMTTYDYLPEIDWQKYNQHCNGGAEFNKIKREFED